MLNSEVTLALGGEDRKLLFDFNAVCRAEEVTGMNLLASIQSYTTARGIRALVWAALVLPNGTSRPSLDTVGGWIGMAGVDVVSTAIMDAWMKAMPESKEGDEEGGEADASAPLSH